MVKLDELFGPSVSMLILSIMLPQSPDDDKWLWMPTDSGKGRSSSAYHLMQDRSHVQQSDWTGRSFLWRLKVSPKFKIFI